MKKILAGGAALSIAAVASLAIGGQTHAASIINTDEVAGTYAGNNRTFEWSPVSGAAAYKIFAYSDTLGNYDLKEVYNGSATSGNITEIVDNYCDAVDNCNENRNVGTYQFVIMGYNADGEAISHSIEYNVEKSAASQSTTVYEVTVRNLFTNPPLHTYTITLDYDGGIPPSDTTNSEIYSGTIYFAPDDTQITTDNSESEYSMSLRAPSGKMLDAIEVNGVRYEKGAPFLFTADSTLRYLWKDLDSLNGAEQTSSEDNTNPNTSAYSPAIMAIFASLLAASSVGLIRRNIQR